MITLILITLTILIGLVGYLHYIMDKQRKEIDRVWAQIVVLALSTAKTNFRNRRKN